MRENMSGRRQRRSLGRGLQRDSRESTPPSPPQPRKLRTRVFSTGGEGDPHFSRDARDQRWKVGEPCPPGGVGRGTGQREQSAWVSGWMCRWPPGGARGGGGAEVRAAAGAGSPAPKLPRTLAHPGEHRPASTPAQHGARALGRKVPQPPGGGEPGPAREAQ